MKRISGATLALTLAIAACGEAPTAPPAGVAVISDLALTLTVSAPSVARRNPGRRLTAPVALAGTLVVYTFDDLPPVCAGDNVLPNPYLDLTFTDVPYFGVCNTAGEPPYPSGTFLIPASSGALVTEHTIVLPGGASSVSVVDGMYYNDSGSGTTPSVRFADADGNVLGTLSWSDFQVISTQTFTTTGAAIASLTIVSGQAEFIVGDLAVTYITDPIVRDDCKDGGWATYGFRNQGQCVAFVETGRDRR